MRTSWNAGLLKRYSFNGPTYVLPFLISLRPRNRHNTETKKQMAVYNQPQRGIDTAVCSIVINKVSKTIRKKKIDNKSNTIPDIFFMLNPNKFYVKVNEALWIL